MTKRNLSRSRGKGNRGNFRGYNPGHRGQHFHQNDQYRQNYPTGQFYPPAQNYPTGHHFYQNQPIDENLAPSSQAPENRRNRPNYQKRNNSRNENNLENFRQNVENHPNSSNHENDREARRKPGNRYENRRNKKNIKKDENSVKKSPSRFNKGTSKAERVQRYNKNERSSTPNEDEKFDELAQGVTKLLANRSKARITEDQRDILGKKLKKGQLECSICLDKMKYFHKIWHCSNCYNLLHLKCAKEWSQSQSKERISEKKYTGGVALRY